MTHPDARCHNCGITRKEAKLYGSLSSPDTCGPCMDKEMASTGKSRPTRIVEKMLADQAEELNKAIEALKHAEANLKGLRKNASNLGIAVGRVERLKRLVADHESKLAEISKFVGDADEYASLCDQIKELCEARNKLVPNQYLQACYPVAARGVK